MFSRFSIALTGALLACAPAAGLAATLWSDDFNTNTSANYNTFITAGATGPSGDVTFAYNYGQDPSVGGLSIPAAPHTTDGSTLGVRIRSDNLQSSVGTVVGASELVTKGLVLPSKYSVSVDVWCNYIGGTNISASGSNGTTGATVGVGTAGTSIQYIAGNDGYLVEAFGDNGGGTNGAYRLYPNPLPGGTRPTPANSSYYPNSSTTFSDPYYTSVFTSVAAPAGQSTFAPTTQGGTTAAGTQGFGWHTWKIINDGTYVSWAIDGRLIGTVPTASMTFGGSQVSLGDNDTGLGGNSAANNQLFNAKIFDNLLVTDVVPEPTSLTLLAMAVFGLVGVRGRK